MDSPILSIAIAKPPYDCFDYLSPKVNHPIVPGMRVQVPFGHSKRMGMVVAVKTDSDVPAGRMKPVDHFLDQHSILPEEILSLLWWASQYYHHPIGDVISTALPSALRKDREPLVKEIPMWRLTEAASSAILSPRAFRQQAILDLLLRYPDGASSHIMQELGFDWRGPLKTCVDKNWVDKFFTSPLTRNAHPLNPDYGINAHQTSAIESIKAGFGDFNVTLLDGVTGSGKTEVYLQLIQNVLEHNLQVLVMIPEIGLSPQLLSRFQQRFSVPITTMHSGMTDQERLNTWLLAQSGEAEIIIGTRSSIFCPFKSLGLILIDEEHDASFKQQSGFRYHARDLAVYRAKKRSIPVVLGTATPSLETRLNVERGRYHVASLPERAGVGSAPAIQLVDLRRQPVKQGLGLKVIEAIHETLAKSEQVLIFLNRRGYAPAIMCHQCGWSAGCHHCDAKMTYHHDDERLRCHHCGYETRLPTECPSCDSDALQRVGMGTQRLEQYVNTLFPGYKVARIDRDSTRRKGTFEDQLDAIHKGETQILVGTQMLAKGHHFPSMTLVVILDIDGSLISGDFRATERLAQQLVQVAGRAGRADKPGRVMIQTLQPEHPMLQQLFTQGYTKYSKMALQERQQA
ncbi:MAG: primosomal protein N', partial [Methylococcales bacterium]|nr:primosomal protein N' [Methylococcales bacterium]